MEDEIIEKLNNIEKSLNENQKDVWDKLQILSAILIPVVIALVGLYFTNEHNRTQSKIQKENNDNQLNVAFINSSVGQSELIKDFMEHLTSSDSSKRNIAIEAILYAAPTPGKKIVDLIAKSNNPSVRIVANEALSAKRIDLVNNLFSGQNQIRIVSANEIISNWRTDKEVVKLLIDKGESCLTNESFISDCENGIYNTIVVLTEFPKEVLTPVRSDIKSLVSKIPITSEKTKSKSLLLLRKLE